MEISGEFKKSAFGGFNRKEVLDYIEQITIRTKENETQLHTKIQEISAANQALEGETIALKEKNQQLEKQLQEKNAQLSTLSEENQIITGKLTETETALSDLVNQSSGTESKLREQEAALTAAQKKLAQLTLQLEEKSCSLERAEARLTEAERHNTETADKLQALEAKSEKYDEFSYQLGEVFLDAHKRADMVLDHALSEAQELATSTNSAAKEIVDDFVSLQDSVRQIRSCVNTSLDVMNRQLACLTKELEEVIQRLHNGISVQQEKPESEAKVSDFIEKAMEQARSSPNKAETALQQNRKKGVVQGKSGLFDGFFHRDK